MVKHIRIFLLALVLVAPVWVLADESTGTISVNGPSSSYGNITTCSTNADCDQGTCSNIQFTDRTVKACARCDAAGATECTAGASACQSSGLCQDQDAGSNTGGECQNDGDCSTRGNGFTCEDVSGTNRCVLTGFDSDAVGGPCRIGQAGEDCGAGYECIEISEGSENGTCVAVEYDEDSVYNDAGDDDASGGSSRGGEGGLVNVLKVDRIDQLAVLILDAIVYLGTLLLILMLVWTGFLFVQAQGAEEKIKEARSSLFWTVIGGLVLLGASGLSLILQQAIQTL